MTTPTTSYTVLDTHYSVPAPKREALTLGACLGADKGVGSRIVRIAWDTFDMVADDDRAIRFTRKPRPRPQLSRW